MTSPSTKDLTAQDSHTSDVSHTSPESQQSSSADQTHISSSPESQQSYLPKQFHVSAPSENPQLTVSHGSKVTPPSSCSKKETENVKEEVLFRHEKRVMFSPSNLSPSNPTVNMESDSEAPSCPLILNPSSDPNNRTILIRFNSYEWTEESLHKFFRDLGVVRIEIALKAKSAMVTFRLRGSAERAMKRVEGLRAIKEGDIRPSVTWAGPRVSTQGGDYQPLPTAPDRLGNAGDRAQTSQRMTGPEIIDMDEQPRRPKSLFRLKVTGVKDKVTNITRIGSLSARLVFLGILALAICSIVGGWIGLSTDTVNKTPRALNPADSNATVNFTTTSMEYDYLPTILVEAPEPQAYLDASLVPTITQVPNVVQKRDTSAVGSYNYGQIGTSQVEEANGSATYEIIIVTMVTTSVVTQTAQETTKTATKTITAVTSMVTTLFTTEVEVSVSVSTCLSCLISPPTGTSSTVPPESVSSVFCLFAGFTNVYTPCDENQTDTPFGAKQTPVDVTSAGNHNMQNLIGHFLRWCLGAL
ncbi:hypothetical protein GGR57DRAFT_502637 [Xylariaceae sp. FL1272]|nr:hypothetical protein GGR57DRAFT_502637 [Xylariaceae sp. FL1272]